MNCTYTLSLQYQHGAPAAVGSVVVVAAAAAMGQT